MAETDQARVTALWEAQAAARDESTEELVEAYVENVRPLGGHAPDHVSDVYEVVLETGRLCIFKPVNPHQPTPALTRVLDQYRQTLVSSVIHECAAWQLVRQLGGPWVPIAVPTVVRQLPVPAGGREVGSLAQFRPGRTGSREYFKAVPAQATAGAFFDCLIGQQDRNRGNVLWHEPRAQIALIDNAFSFMRNGDERGVQELQEWRWHNGDRALDADEMQAVSAVLNNDLFGLRGYLEADRADSLLARAEHMRDHGQLLPWRGRLHLPEQHT